MSAQPSRWAWKWLGCPWASCSPTPMSHILLSSNAIFPLVNDQFLKFCLSFILFLNLGVLEIFIVETTVNFTPSWFFREHSPWWVRSQLHMHVYVATLLCNWCQDLPSQLHDLQDKFLHLSVGVAASYCFFQVPDIVRMAVLNGEKADYLSKAPTQVLVLVLYWFHILNTASNIVVCLVFCDKFKRFCQRVVENFVTKTRECAEYSKTGSQTETAWKELFLDFVCYLRWEPNHEVMTSEKKPFWTFYYFRYRYCIQPGSYLLLCHYWLIW